LNNVMIILSYICI